MNLVFIFCQPRSGSTLLQRMIACHPGVATNAEPWLLLPHLTADNPKIQQSVYSTRLAKQAIDDLKNNVGPEFYKQKLRQFFKNTYRGLVENNETYVLDKTPRYYWIIPQIREMFPEAKFIFLFRHPGQVFSSTLHTWHENRFKNLIENYGDLWIAPSKITAAWKKYQNNAIRIQYDDIIHQPKKTLGRIFDYLNLPPIDYATTDFSSIKLNGVMKDPTGVNQYKRINKTPLNKWKKTFSNPFRKYVLNTYIREIGEDVVDGMGYSAQQIKSDLQDLPNQYSSVLNDMFERWYFRRHLKRHGVDDWHHRKEDVFIP